MPKYLCVSFSSLIFQFPDFMGGHSGTGSNYTGSQGKNIALPSRNLFQPGQKFDLFAYLSESVSALFRKF